MTWTIRLAVISGMGAVVIVFFLGVPVYLGTCLNSDVGCSNEGFWRAMVFLGPLVSGVCVAMLVMRIGRMVER